MDNTKGDGYYIGKIVNDIDFIIKHTSNISLEKFSKDEVLQDSMMFRLIQISENSGKLTDSYKTSKSNIPWRQIYGLRNRIVHDYGNVDFEIIYDTLTNDIPKLATYFK